VRKLIIVGEDALLRLPLLCLLRCCLLEDVLSVVNFFSSILTAITNLFIVVVTAHFDFAVFPVHHLVVIAVHVDLLQAFLAVEEVLVLLRSIFPIFVIVALQVTEYAVVLIL
jgi:hypothetical protein